MNCYCDKLQERLAIEGLIAIKDNQNAQDHLAECEACFAVFEAIEKLDPLLKSLPLHDAPDELVNKTMNAIQEAEGESKVIYKPTRRWSSFPKVLKTWLLAFPRVISRNMFRFPKHSAQIASLVLVLCTASIIFLNHELRQTFNFTDSQMSKRPVISLDPTRSYSEEKSSDAYYPVGQPEMPAEESTEEINRDLKAQYYAKNEAAKKPEAKHSTKDDGQTKSDSDLVIVLNDIEHFKKESKTLTDNLAVRTEEFDQRDERGAGKVVDQLDRSPENEGMASQAMAMNQYSYVGGLSGNIKSELSKHSVSGAESFESDNVITKTKKGFQDSQWRLNKYSDHESSKPTSDSADMNKPVSQLAFAEKEIFDQSINNRFHASNRQRSIGETIGLDKQVNRSDTNLESSISKQSLTEQGEVLRQLKLSKSKQAHELRHGDRKKTEAGEKLNSNKMRLLTVSKPTVIGKRESSRLESQQASSLHGKGRMSQTNYNNIQKQLINKTAERFLSARDNTNNLRFKQAAGYWANNYVPGDPTVRRLHTSLLGKSLQSLEQSVGKILKLHDGAHQTSQPFDVPENSALAVYLHADQTGLLGKQRMLMQVGLQGSSRRSGIRPTMNVGIVFDLRGKLEKQTITQMQSLLFALNKARDIGDRFSLVFAGKHGGIVVEPDQFRHGPLMVAMQNLERANSKNAGLGLTEAIKTAMAQVSASDNPTAPLGSSVVLLITHQSIRSDLNTLAKLAHQSAVAGIPVSTIATATGAVVNELDQIALAGQGNRRVLHNASDAYKLINKELSSVSEVVARAVRLRIRLAAGVKLVNVIGSYRLDKTDANRVRQAEASIDRRLSRNLGIESDRGADEAGIQIVIPAFYADTSHVVMLDVVAPGPGPIADVTVRYKDLVQLKNGVARANLSLNRTEHIAGPLERNVTKNLLAFQLAQSLVEASKMLKTGQPEKSGELIYQQLALLESFRDTVPGFDRDPDISADINMLKEYGSIMQNRSYKVQAKVLIDSMAFAGKMKILPRPSTE